MGDSATQWTSPREGKRLTTWEQSVELDGVERSVRRVLRLVDCTIDAQGQVLIAPDYVLEGWTTTLPLAQFSAQAIITAATRCRMPCGAASVPPLRSPRWPS